MNNRRYHSLLPYDEDILGPTRLAPRDPKVYSDLRRTSKVRRSRIPRPIRESFSQGAAVLGLLVLLTQAPAAGGGATSTSTGEALPPAEVSAPDATASEGQFTAIAEFTVDTTYSSAYTPPSASFSPTYSIKSEDFFEAGEFARLVTLLEGLPPQLDDTDEFDPDPII